jgi:hypothetical protein
MKTKGGEMKRRLACLVALVVSAVCADGVRYPLQDTSVSRGSKDSTYLHEKFLRIGNGFDACVMLPVEGLANVTSAKFKFYVPQCGEGAKYPLYFRVMRDDRWHHNMLTWNALPDEFRFAHPAMLAQDDPSLAGYLEIGDDKEGHPWYELDITKAVKAAAPCGRLALHIFTSWVQSETDNTTLLIQSRECDTASQRPCLSFTGEADSSAASMTIVASADTHVYSGSPETNFGDATDAVMVDKAWRQAFIKFDLSGINSDSVDSAMLQFYIYPSTSAELAFTSDDGIQFALTPKTDWDEMSVTWKTAKDQTGIAPEKIEWEADVPSNAIRGPSSDKDRFYRIDVAKLVNQVLAARGKTLSLHVLRNPSDSKRYFFFCPREDVNEAYRPRLLVTPKVDAALVARKALQDTFVRNDTAADTAADTAYHPWMQYNRNPPWDYIQVGCDGTSVQYGLMLFDPFGLEDADFVRLRIKVNKFPAGEGALRVTAWQSDRWNATNLTWNTLSPWFPQPATITQATVLDGEIASLKRTHSESSPYIELDVTDIAKAAAKVGKHVTFGFFSNGTWPEIYRGESAYPAVLLFPDIDGAFGNRVTCSLDLGGVTPALRLDWSPSATADVTYTVERQSGEKWLPVASGLTAATCVDPNAEPWVAHTYRITESVNGESVVKTVTLDATVSVMACADTYVMNGGKRNNRFGTGDSLVHKYDNGVHTAGVREGFYRFDLNACPDDFSSVSFNLSSTGDGNHSGNEQFWVLTYPDFSWTDASAPTWNEVFKNGYATPMVFSGEPDGVRSEAYKVATRNVTESLTAGTLLEFDVTAAVRAAKKKGQTHITFHTCAYDPNNGWNFGIVSLNGVRGAVYGPQLTFKMRNWVTRSLSIILR